MATTIRCEKKILREVFKLWFRVPEYQRPYVWGTDQVKELLDDTYDAFIANAEAQYFIGSMVLKINKITDADVAYEEYELLDGQQRLTTLLMLYAVIRDVATKNHMDEKLIEGCRKAIFQEKDEYEGVPARARIVYDIRADVRSFVNKYIHVDGGTDNQTVLKAKSEDKTSNVSIRNMSAALLTMREFIEEHIRDLPEYYLYLVSKVLMIYVATEELQDAFQLFTVLNNRGVKLSNSDILKAQNLGAVANDIERSEWAQKWEEMESYFGEGFDQFLSHIRTILVKRKASTTVLKEFEDNVYSNRIFNRTTKQYEACTPLLSRGCETFRYINDFFKLYDDLFGGMKHDKNGLFSVYNYLQLMRIGLGTDIWIPPVLDYYKRFENDRFVDFLKALDRKVSADWITSLSPAKRIENINALLRDIEKASSPDNLLCSSALAININDFTGMISGDVYGKRFARYLVLKLDFLYQGNTTPFNPPETISIEHILPQHPDKTSQWCRDFTEEDMFTWTDKLGNLALISRKKNTSQGNRDFADKMERYFKTNIETFANSIRILQSYHKWTMTELRDNHTRVVERLMSEYR